MRALPILLIASILAQTQSVRANLTLVSHNATGPAYAVTQADGIYYAGLGGRLHLLSSDLDIISHVDLPSVIDGIVVQENLAYVATWFEGICILDLAAPNGPQLVGQLQLPSQGRGISVENSTAYVASSEAGLRIVDVSQPNNPVEIGFYDTPFVAYDVFVDAGYAYVADRNGGVIILNISVPSSPQYVTTYTLGGSYQARDVDKEGDYLFVAYAGTGLRVVNVSNPGAPVPVGALGMLEDVFGVTVVNDIAYLSKFGGGLAIVDVSSPSAPSLIGNLVTDGNSYEAAVQGQHIVLADGDESIRLINVATPSTPSEVLRLDPVGRAAEVAMDGSNLVVVNFAKTSNGFRILDAANPTNVEQISRFVTAGTTPDAAVNDGYVYIAEQEPNFGLTTAGIQDPRNPESVSHLAFGNPPTGIDIANGRAYLTFGDRMRIVNVQDPEFPSVLGTFLVGLPTTFLADVTVAGTTAYVYDYDIDGIRIVNVANPGSPQQIGTYQAPGIVFDVAVDGNIAYLGTSEGLQVIDVSTPSNPTLISNLPFPSECFAVLLKESTAYVCAGPSGVFAVDISDPTTPLISGQYDTDRAGAACLYYDYIVVADVSNGIFVLADDTAVATRPIATGPVLRAYPNPFNPSTTVSFSVPTSGNVSLRVFDPHGALVRTLATGRYDAGIHTASWDGLDGAGNPSASGVYFCRLTASSHEASLKLVLIK